MNVIEQLSLEKNQLCKLQPTKEVLDKIRLLDDIIEKLKSEKYLDEVSKLTSREIIEIKPSSTVYPLLWNKICSVLEVMNKESENPYWTNLIGVSIDELENELDAWLIFSSDNYGARNLLNDMETNGEILVLNNGTVKRNNLKEEATKKEIKVKKRS